LLPADFNTFAWPASHKKWLSLYLHKTKVAEPVFFVDHFNNDLVKNSTVVLCYDMKYLCATLRNRGGSLRNNTFWVGCYAKLREE
jgi:hypothetical protein